MNLSLAHLLYDKPSKDLSEKDYYPFGMVMPERSFSYENYGFGFNGKENDNEVKGYGNQQDYGMRIYDIRLGRFLSVDPITDQYPELTPYQFASNTPIWGIDQDGEEVRLYIDAGDYLHKNFGHTFISIGSGDDVVVYTYGRYNGYDKPKLDGASPTGDGVLKRFRGKEANNYIKDYVVNYDANVFEILDIQKEEEGKVINHFDQLLQSSERLPDNPDGKYYNDPDARIIDKYDWTEGNNCTSNACGGIKETNSKLFTYHVTRTNGAGDILYDQDKKHSFVKPSFLETYLRFKSNEKNPIVKEITDDLKLGIE